MGTKGSKWAELSKSLFAISDTNFRSEFLKVGILGSRIPDIISEKFGHFGLKP